MPRYYRRRYTRVVKPKKKWASNIVVWEQASVGSPYVINLAINSTQPNTPTPTILKVGNFKITADLVARYSSSVSPTNIVANCFIIFVPEGIADSAVPSLVGQHPEYVLVNKVCGSSMATGTDLSLETLNVSSRLKRNLNSGDRVVLLMAMAGATTPQTMTISGSVRFWCCSN